MLTRLRLGFVIVVAALATAAAQERRLLNVDDIFAFKSVSDPRLSPDGQWVAYTISQMDAKKDASDADIWMSPIDGGPAVRLTTSEKGESSPRWSPDGRYLGFLSSRDGGKTQVWLHGHRLRPGRRSERRLVRHERSRDPDGRGCRQRATLARARARSQRVETEVHA